MKNELIANTLRYYRKQENLSVQDVVLLLKENNINISPKTIYAWENGNTKPDIPTMMVLCSLYHIPNIQQLLGQSIDAVSKDAPLYLSPEERALIANYRRHPEMHEAVRKLLE